MAVYTDGEHLMADTVTEFHTFAEKIGIDRRWFREHKYQYYHVFMSDLEKVFMHGARFLETRELIIKFKSSANTNFYKDFNDWYRNS